jgi:hypothetical protein
MDRQRWQAMLEAQGETIWIWVSERSGRDVVRAALPRPPAHPRALLGVLEGLALWSGAPLGAVLGVDRPRGASLGLDVYGFEGWPADSALVSFAVRHPARPRRALGRLDEGTGGDDGGAPGLLP